MQRRATLRRDRIHIEEGTQPAQKTQAKTHKLRRGGQLQRPSCSVTQSVEERLGILMWPRNTRQSVSQPVYTQVPCFGGLALYGGANAAVCPRGRCASSGRLFRKFVPATGMYKLVVARDRRGSTRTVHRKFSRGPRHRRISRPGPTPTTRVPRTSRRRRCLCSRVHDRRPHGRAARGFVARV